MAIRRRDFLSMLGAGVVSTEMPILAQRGRPIAPGEVRGAKPAAPPPPVRKATITKLFKTPDGHPNALDTSSEGLWIGEQVTDRAVLMDLMSGKVLKAFQTECHNCSGLAVGGGYLWMSANGAAQFDRPIKIDRTTSEIVQCDMNGNTVKRHPIPLGGGGATGIEYVDGNLWMVASRLRVLMQVHAETFQPILAHPLGQLQRPHGLAWDNGAMWVVDGTDEPRLVKLDAKTGNIIESIQLAVGDPDPHGLAMVNGRLYFCDAGIHPGWERDKSPHTGWVCRVDVIS